MSQEEYFKRKQVVFFRSRDSFRNESTIRRFSKVQSEKQQYFISEFLKTQQELYSISEDIYSENIVWKSARELLPGAVSAIGGTGLYLVSKNNFPSGTMPGNALALGGIALLVAGCIYSHKTISDCLEAKKRAGATLEFLGKNKKDSHDLMETIAFDLYDEFRLSIEMMAKSSKGIDQLILFFTQQIFSVPIKIPSSELSKYTEKEEKVAYLKAQIFGDKNSFPKESLLTDYNDQFNLGWKLDELMIGAPIVQVSCLGSEDEAYRFVIYTNVSDGKTRFNPLQLNNIIPHSVSADDTHKYPLRIIYTHEEMRSRKGYSHYEGAMLPEQSCITPNKISASTYKPFPSEVVFNLIKFYFHLRICRQAPTDKKNFALVLERFATLARWVIHKNGSETDFFAKFLILQNLRHTYWQVLKETIKEKCYFDSTSIFPLWDQAHQLFCKLCGFCSNEALVQQKIRNEERAGLYFNTNEEISNINEADNFDRNFNYLRKHSIYSLSQSNHFEDKPLEGDHARKPNSTF